MDPTDRHRWLCRHTPEPLSGIAGHIRHRKVNSIISEMFCCPGAQTLLASFVADRND